MKRIRDPYKVNMLVAMLKEMETDKYFLPKVTASGKLDKGIKNINLDEEAIRTLITYYGG